MLTLVCGEDVILEDAATALLLMQREQLMTTGPLTRRRDTGYGKLGTPSQYHFEDLNDWLTRDQWALRLSREVPVPNHLLGEYARRGMYKRSYNPLLGRRPTPKYLFRQGMDPWRQQLWEDAGDNWFYHPGHMCYPRTNFVDRRPFPGDPQ